MPAVFVALSISWQVCRMRAVVMAGAAQTYAPAAVVHGGQTCMQTMDAVDQSTA